MKRFTFFYVALLVTALFAGTSCTAAPESNSEPVTLRLMTHDSFDISQEVLAAFTEETGIEIEVFKAGDGAEMLNKAILARNNPLADVIFGIDNTFLGRALDNDVLLAYESPALSAVSPEYQIDPQSRALPVDFGDVCLNYDVVWFESSGMQPPDSLGDLISPEYAGLTVVENPATSTPGMAFLLTSLAEFGEDGYLDYWSSLRENGLLVVDGWEQAYYEHFSAASDGDRPIVVSYASSPAAEVYFAETPPERAPTAAVLTDGTCFRQIEFVGILKGTQHVAEAQKLIDFMLGRAFQEDIPLHMFVYPVNETAELPDVFNEHARVSANPVTVDPDQIKQNRQSWIEAWTNTVLR